MLEPSNGRLNGPAAEMGLAILSGLSVAGLHSAVNPSLYTLRTFASRPSERSAAMDGLWIGLGLGLLTSVGIGLVFKRWIPAVVSGATAMALFGLGVHAVHAEAPPVSTMQEKRNEQVRQTGVAGLGWIQPSVMSVPSRRLSGF